MNRKNRANMTYRRRTTPAARQRAREYAAMTPEERAQVDAWRREREEKEAREKK